MSALLPPLGRRIGHRLRRETLGRLPGARELPTYFIVGAKRAGTTSLDEYLVAHPLVLRGLVEKGCRYYDVHHHRGPRWYRRHLPTVRRLDRLERRLGSRPIFGESSPYYAVHPDAAARIAADVPAARLILVLRDPVERAWSHHRYEVARGYEDLDFGSALRAEQSRLADPDPRRRAFAHRHFGYLSRSRYAEQVERLRGHFPAEQILVVVSERLFADPAGALTPVFAHLGLSPDPSPGQHYRPHKALGPAPVPGADARWLLERLLEDRTRLVDLLGEHPGEWRRPEGA